MVVEVPRHETPGGFVGVGSTVDAKTPPNSRLVGGRLFRSLATRVARGRRGDRIEHCRNVRTWPYPEVRADAKRVRSLG
jgi:hypothetical protein